MNAGLLYDDFIIAPFEENFIEKVEREFDVSSMDADLEPRIKNENGRLSFGNVYIGNIVIDHVLSRAVYKHVTNEDDIAALMDSMDINGFASGFGIEPDQLVSQEAKDFLERFNNL